MEYVIVVGVKNKKVESQGQRKLNTRKNVDENGKRREESNAE